MTAFPENKTFPIQKIVPKKIIIVGTSGSGKTTFGNDLSKVTKIDCTDLDDLYWLPNWQERDEIDFMDQVTKITSSEQWIICGNYSKILQKEWSKADTLIWLDMPLRICLWRAFKRGFSRALSQIPCCNGNYESLSRLFGRKSILIWIWNTYSRRKKDYNKSFSYPNDYQNFIRLRNNEGIRLFLESLKNSKF